MPPPRIPDTSSHSSSEEGSQQAPTIGSDRVLDKDLDMVHDRNCKARMVGRFLLRSILAVGDILWAYFKISSVSAVYSFTLQVLLLFSD